MYHLAIVFVAILNYFITLFLITFTLDSKNTTVLMIFKEGRISNLSCFVKPTLKALL
jgi:hypothetical protein